MMNYKQLKIFALCCMAFDHVVRIFPPKNLLAPALDRLWLIQPGLAEWIMDWGFFGLMFIGRMAAPVFLFCIANGFFRTHDVRRYLARIGVTAVIAQLPYIWFHLAEQGRYGVQGDWREAGINILFTLALGLAALAVYNALAKRGRGWLGLLVGLGAALTASWLGLEGGRGYILLIFVFWFTRDRPRWQRALIFLPAVLLARWGLVEWVLTDMSAVALRNCVLNVGGNYLGMLVTLAYNGEKGRTGKGFQRFMYAFYPAHFALLALLSRLCPPLA